ncbi:MAG: DUF1501 domain-containing protein [Planctomycetota bacterium]|jgi:uncharacterized protein (DUF1501 family)
MSQNHPNRRGITRRRFLRNSALSAGAVSILPILGTRPARAVQGNKDKFMVVINQLGGNDGLNTVVPTHLTPYVVRRPTINLVENLPGTSSLHDIGGGFKLHYNLPTLKDTWDASEMHIVQKVSYPNPNQSHFTSQDIFSHGVRNSGDNDGRGWLGRFADEFCSNPSEPLGVVSVGMGRRRDFEAEVTTPLILANVQGFVVDSDNDYRTDHVLRERVAEATLASESEPTSDPARPIFLANKLAYDLVEQVQSETEGWSAPDPVYPNTTLGRNLKTVSQLLHGRDSFQTKVFYTGFGGFDTHSDQQLTDPDDQGRHANLMKQLDDAVAVFRQDLMDKGMWEDCVIVVISEFGRRIFENASFGTDHGHGNCFLVLGGDIAGKTITGDLVEDDVKEGRSTVPFQYDFRDLYGSVIQNHLGLSPTPLFPDPSYNPAINDINLF